MNLNHKLDRTYEIKHFKVLDSTNLFGLKNFQHLNNYTVILADKQTQGRGRLLRKWQSLDDEGLYLSIILKDLQDYEKAQKITQIAALAIINTLMQFNIPAEMKWPNDVLVQKKKVSGILSETVILNSSLKGLVVGVGINVNNNKEFLEKIDQPATSFAECLKKKINKMEVLQIFLNFFFEYLSMLKVNKGNAVFAEWKKFIQLENKIIKVDSGAEIITGKVLSINNDGTLQILDFNNQEITVFSGDIKEIK